MNKRILHLTLKKEWFKQIAQNEKKQEFREVKPHWEKRFYHEDNGAIVESKYDEVHFRNGYAKDAPFMRVECLGVDHMTNIKTPIGEGEFFVINLGEVLEIKNYKEPLQNARN